MRFLLSTLLLVFGLSFHVSAQDRSPRLSVASTTTRVTGSEEPKFMVMLQLDEQKKVEVANDGTHDNLLGSEHIPFDWIESVTLVTDHLELAPYGEKAKDGILLITLKEGWKESELFERYR